jgi:hypothetical protein
MVKGNTIDNGEQPLGVDKPDRILDADATIMDILPEWRPAVDTDATAVITLINEAGEETDQEPPSEATGDKWDRRAVTAMWTLGLGGLALLAGWGAAASLQGKENPPIYVSVAPPPTAKPTTTSTRAITIPRPGAASAAPTAPNLSPTSSRGSTSSIVEGHSAVTSPLTAASRGSTPTVTVLPHTSETRPSASTTTEVVGGNPASRATTTSTPKATQPTPGSIPTPEAAG